MNANQEPMRQYSDKVPNRAASSKAEFLSVIKEAFEERGKGKYTAFMNFRAQSDNLAVRNNLDSGSEYRSVSEESKKAE